MEGVGGPGGPSSSSSNLCFRYSHPVLSSALFTSVRYSILVNVEGLLSSRDRANGIPCYTFSFFFFFVYRFIATGRYYAST